MTFSEWRKKKTEHTQQIGPKSKTNSTASVMTFAQWRQSTGRAEQSTPEPAVKTEEISARELERNALVAVSDPMSTDYDPDFESKSTYVSTKIGGGSDGYFDVPTYDFYTGTAGEYDTGYGDITYEYINGNSEISELVVGKEHNYYYMNDDERKVYNYYHYMDEQNGTQIAQHYLELIQQDLNERAAEVEYEAYQGKPVRKILHAAKSGIHNFGTTTDNWYRQSDGYIAPTTTQLVSGKIKEDLDGVGRVAYDVIETIFNMAPSMLASFAVGMINPALGSVVGNTLMAGSAGGSAYQQKINEGYTQDQANTYGLLIGAAEATIGELLGGITKLGGKGLKLLLKNLGKVDDILAKVAKSVGGKILRNGVSEGTEEFVQSYIEPFLAHIVTGEEVTHNWEESLYNGLLGFLTGGILEAAGQITGSISSGAEDGAIGNSENKANSPATVVDETADEKHTDSKGIGPKEEAVQPPQTTSTTFDGSNNGVDRNSEVAPTSAVSKDGQVQKADGSAVEWSTEQLLQQVMDDMGRRPMNPKTYNALFGYKTQLEQRGRVENLLAQQQEILARQKAEGATAYDIGKTEANIAQLQKKLAARQGKLNTAENTPTLQQITEKTRSRLLQEATTPTVENSRKNVLDNPEESAIIDIDTTTQEMPLKNATQNGIDNNRLAGIIKRNREAGKRAELHLFSIFNGTMENLESQVTIQIAGSDIRIRVDAMGFEVDENGNRKLRILEFKASKTASLTKNQKKGFPLLAVRGGTVVGRKKPGIPYRNGYVIQPGVQIEVIRIDEGGRWYVSDRF